MTVPDPPVTLSDVLAASVPGQGGAARVPIGQASDDEVLAALALARPTGPTRAPRSASPPSLPPDPRRAPALDPLEALLPAPTPPADIAPASGLPLLLTVEQAAEYTGLTRTALYELQAAGVLVGVKVGRRRFWRRSDLDAFVAALQPSNPRSSARPDLRSLAS